MALTPIKALLFLAGGTAAAGGVAYVSGVLDPYLGGEAPKLALAAPPATTGEAPGKLHADPKTARLPQPPAAEAPSSPQTPAGDEAAGQEVLPPSFDVVRVEGDGSIVIAGKAAAGATVEIVAGARVIGNAVAGPDGDFAVVVDEPLKPGGYQIVLRSTAPDKVVATSLETAVVSIPEKSDGQVLALVEKPGQPSKLITVPEPQPAPPLNAEPEGQASGGPAAPGNEPAASGDTAAANAPEAPASADAQKPAASADAETPAAESTTGEPAKAQKPEQQPSEPAASDLAAAEPEPGEQPKIEVKPGAPVELTPSAPTGDAKVAVEAVEIEGRKVFVAGVADAGRKVRVYANDILLGEAEASPGGQFLIETERDLPVGDYIIRADAIEPDNVKVAARAAVPFEREAGENLAAVAPSAASGSTAAPSPGTGAQSSAEAQPPADTPASGQPAAAPATTASSQVSPSGSAVASQTASDAAAPKPAATASAPAAEASAPGRSSKAPAGNMAAAAPAASASTSSAADAEIAATPEATALAPKLESVGGAVIIRRGDSLWRISRRVYGKGIRYSTIYLANQEQISDPDLIWPGQVFTVPEKTSEGEAADMKAVGEQATTATTQ